MKAIIIILGCLLLAFVLRIMERILSLRKIKSVGARSNRKSIGMTTINIYDPESLKEGLEHYKDLDD